VSKRLRDVEPSNIRNAGSPARGLNLVARALSRRPGSCPGKLDCRIWWAGV